jgi:hypothetical protein
MTTVSQAVLIVNVRNGKWFKPVFLPVGLEDPSVSAVQPGTIANASSWSLLNTDRPRPSREVASP